MATKRRRRKKWHEPSRKARERLHALRMLHKPGYADAYLKSLGFNEREIEVMKSHKYTATHFSRGRTGEESR